MWVKVLSYHDRLSLVMNEWNKGGLVNSIWLHITCAQLKKGKKRKRKKRIIRKIKIQIKEKKKKRKEDKKERKERKKKLAFKDVPVSFTFWQIKVAFWFPKPVLTEQEHVSNLVSNY